MNIFATLISDSSLEPLLISETTHEPVLLSEAMAFLDPKPGEVFLDGTLGGGGHTGEILKKLAPQGTLIALDWDNQSMESTRERFATQHPDLLQGAKIFWVHSNFKYMVDVLDGCGINRVDGVLLDLGFSSDQMTGGSGRGFSYAADEPLLMTYNNDTEPVRELLQDITEDDLRSIIRHYGEERYAGRVARAIKTATKKKMIETSKELGTIVARVLPHHYERGRMHPATRTFMALRIYTNQELENLNAALDQLPRILKSGGRVGIITFHSLEDRIVKKRLLEYERLGLGLRHGKKPIAPSLEEVGRNSRARSAKFRGFTFS